MVTVTSNISSVLDKYRQYPIATVRRAANAAINDAIKTTRNEYADAIAAEANVGKSTAKAAIRVKRSTVGTLTGSATASGKPISLKYYGGRQTASGVTAKIQGKRWTIEGGWRSAKMGNHFYKRTRDARTPYATERRAKGTGPRKDPRPFYQLTGPAIPAATSERQLALLCDGARVRFGRRLDYHVGRIAARRKAAVPIRAG
jgi:hypothetical protein